MLDETVMQIEAIRRPFTVEEYDRIREARILDDPGRIELLDGEVLEMSPIGPRHEACVDRAAELFHAGLRAAAIIRVQGSVRMGAYSRPQPDLVLLQRRKDFYVSIGAAIDNALLVSRCRTLPSITTRDESCEPMPATRYENYGLRTSPQTLCWYFANPPKGRSKLNWY